MTMILKHLEEKLFFQMRRGNLTTFELKEFQMDTVVDTSVKGATPMTAENVQLLNPSHGENVYSLAMQFGLDWRMIALANNIDDPSDIAGNMDLIIPMVTGKNI